ncbi:iron-containing alcohol dehydrogenase [Paraburkholderia sediminicola]|uniref:iron-containing alcohol dehydrogenase n=1 Tax=Paraburkholderia sediminicola TaxID=458836 RepID=UPI0038B6E1FD
MSQRSFIYSPLPGRVVFGPDSGGQLPTEFRALHIDRALVLCTPDQSHLADDIAALLGDQCAGVFPKTAMHVPIELAREARDEARRVGADGIVAVGGGSTISLGKATALERDAIRSLLDDAYHGRCPQHSAAIRHHRTIA